MTADTFRTLRRSLHLTQAQLAQRLGVSRATVQNWEAGIHRIPPPAAQLVETWMERINA
jgi:DNA-binding transcriptional regulator YiaG